MNESTDDQDSDLVRFVSELTEVCKGYHPAVSLEGMSKYTGCVIGMFSNTMESVEEGVRIAKEYTKYYARRSFEIKENPEAFSKELFNDKPD
jgi:hypothetical protein